MLYWFQVHSRWMRLKGSHTLLGIHLEKTVIPRDLSVHCSTIYNSQDMGAT